MIVQYTDAQIYQPDGTFISSIFVEKGQIVSPQGPPDEIHSLAGKYIFPTFEDAHNHPSGMCRANYHLNLEMAKTQDSLAVLLAPQIKKNSFVIGVRWNENQGGSLTRAFLDDISPEVPLVVVEQSYHRAYLNSSAQEYFQLPSGFPGNKGSGILEEQAWIEWAWPRLHTDVLLFQQSLLEFQQLLLSHGIGAVHDLFLGTRAHLTIYQELLSRNEWKVNLTGYLSPHLLPEVRREQFPFLKGVKLFLDGSFGAYTACLKSPYLNRPEYSGYLWWDLAELQKRIRLSVQQGFFQIALHTIGDGAVEQAIELIRWATQEFGCDLQFRLEHASLLDLEQLEQLIHFQVAFCLQPNFIPGDCEFQDRLGDRTQQLLPLNRYVRSGAKIGFGSDHLPTDPWYGIRATTEAPLTQQRLSWTQAIHYYTLGSASLVQQEHLRGSLVPGK
ncbi:MAG: amidohydrolase family protein, partial [Planctomycetota bacterium]